MFYQLMRQLMVLGMLCACPQVFGTSYGYTIITRHDAVIDGRVLILAQQSDIGLPAINDSGDVAFYARFQGGEGIFLNDKVIATTGASIDSLQLTAIINNAVGLNGSGEVVFEAGYNGGFGIFTQAHALYRTGDIIDGFPVAAGFPEHYFQINGSGNVSVTVNNTDYNSDPDYNRVIIDETGILIKQDDIIGGRIIKRIETDGGLTSINAMNQIAFRATFRAANGPDTLGIFTRERFITGIGSVQGGRTITQLANFPLINQAGEVSYIAEYSPSSQAGIFIETQLVVSVGDMIEGNTIISFNVGGPHAVNSIGDLAFRAVSEESAPGDALFTRNRRVLGYDDILMGRRVDGVFIGPSAINVHGQIALAVRFDDATWAVIRADPVTPDDADGDDVPDNEDAFPLDPDEWVDTDDDGDGMSDTYEISNKLNPLDKSDQELDRDGDGLTNLHEFLLGTSADNSDTDGDGVDDNTEYLAGRNPVVNEAAVIMIIGTSLSGE